MAKPDKNWIEAGKQFIALGDYSSASLLPDDDRIKFATHDLPEAEKKVYRFSAADIPSVTMTFDLNPQHERTVPIFMREPDGSKTLMIIAPNFLSFMLALGLWGVEW